MYLWQQSSSRFPGPFFLLPSAPDKLGEEKTVSGALTGQSRALDAPKLE